MTRIIFCLTTGRSGTMYLSHVLNSIPGIEARHEPPPNFHTYQTLPFDEKCKWIEEEKIPEIERITWQGDVYIETSNLFNQGWVEPLLHLGIPFDVIWLKRATEDVAISFWRKTVIPGRTHLGWHMRPDHESNVLRAREWAHWTDYTCCLWLTMEKEARNEKYAPMIAAAGGQVVETSTGEIVSETGFMKLIAELNLPLPDAAYHEIKNEHLNATRADLSGYWPPDGLGKQKDIILNSISRGK